MGPKYSRTQEILIWKIGYWSKIWTHFILRGISPLKSGSCPAPLGGSRLWWGALLNMALDFHLSKGIFSPLPASPLAPLRPCQLPNLVTWAMSLSRPGIYSLWEIGSSFSPWKLNRNWHGYSCGLWLKAQAWPVPSCTSINHNLASKSFYYTCLHENSVFPGEEKGSHKTWQLFMCREISRKLGTENVYKTQRFLMPGALFITWAYNNHSNDRSKNRQRMLMWSLMNDDFLLCTHRIILVLLVM